MSDTFPPTDPGKALAGGKISSDNLRPARIDPDRPLPTSRGVLSAAEIEALLRPDLPEPERPPTTTTDRPIPDLSAAEDDALSQQDAARLCARLGLSVHRETGLALALDLLEMRRCGFRQAFPAPETGAAYACFGSGDGEVQAILVLSAAMAAALIDQSCGGDARVASDSAPRALTEIDTALLTRAVEPMAAHLPGGALLCLEARAAFSMSIAPPGPATTLMFDVDLDGATCSAHLILSDAALAAPPVSPEALAQSAAPTISGGALTALLTARIASLSVPVSRLSNLKPGATLMLGLPADEPVQLLSGGRTGLVAAEGEIGRKGGKIAVRITRRGPALLR